MNESHERSGTLGRQLSLQLWPSVGAARQQHMCRRRGHGVYALLRYARRSRSTPTVTPAVDRRAVRPVTTDTRDNRFRRVQHVRAFCGPRASRPTRGRKFLIRPRSNDLFILSRSVLFARHRSPAVESRRYDFTLYAVASLDHIFLRPGGGFVHAFAFMCFPSAAHVIIDGNPKAMTKGDYTPFILRTPLRVPHVSATRNPLRCGRRTTNAPLDVMRAKSHRPEPYRTVRKSEQNSLSERITSTEFWKYQSRR